MNGFIPLSNNKLQYFLKLQKKNPFFFCNYFNEISVLSLFVLLIFIIAIKQGPKQWATIQCFKKEEENL